MINMKKEKLYSLSQATRFVPSIDGKRVHASTLWRWSKRGCRGIRLEHVRLGRRILTSQEAINRFGNKLASREETSFAASYPLPKITRSSQNTSEREKAIRDAEHELHQSGVIQGVSNE